jgi:heme exporter protein B
MTPHPAAARPSWIRSALSVFLKDWQSELRTRYAISALLMFVLTTIAIVLFALGTEGAPAHALAGMLWVVIFFSGMSGLARTFVTEEERGTAMTLQLTAAPSAVYTGKLLFNLVLVYAVNAVAVLLFFFFIQGFEVRTPSIFLVTLFLGSTGLAVMSTLIAAIIAKANTKGTLFPVLSFPLLLPLLLAVINATRLSAEGAFFTEALGEFQVLISYIGAVLTVSYLVFDYVWKD